jgi:SAM-dependent methyltransferase
MNARERGLVFGEVAAQYDRARPDYPPDLFADVLEFAQFAADDRVLDVGAGTGKATAGFVAAGVPVVALEPSAAMAEVARTRLARSDPADVSMVEQSFEAWPLEPAAFAVVAAAQSWHWVDPSTRLAKACAALRSSGAIALFWNQPYFPDSDLRVAIDAAYQQVAPEMDGYWAASRAPRVSTGQAIAIEELGASGEFIDFEVREYQRNVSYDGAAYVDLLGTHSDHRLLDDDRRIELLDRVGALVDAAGGIVVDYRTSLALARRAADSSPR